MLLFGSVSPGSSGALWQNIGAAPSNIELTANATGIKADLPTANKFKLLMQSGLLSTDAGACFIYDDGNQYYTTGVFDTGGNVQNIQGWASQTNTDQNLIFADYTGIYNVSVLGSDLCIVQTDSKGLLISSSLGDVFKVTNEGKIRTNQKIPAISTGLHTGDVPVYDLLGAFLGYIKLYN